MPVIRSIKYKKIKSLLSDDDHAKLASSLVDSDNPAIHFDFSSSKIENVDFLKYYHGITHLALQGIKDFELGHHIPNTLEDLCLLECNIHDYTPLAHLENLKVLDHRFGNIDSITGLDKLTSLLALHFMKMNGIHNLEPISHLQNLSWLKINGCKSVSHFPNLSKQTQLNRIILEHCSHIKDLSNITTAPNLEYFILEAKGLEVAQLQKLQSSNSPKKVLPGIGTINSNEFIQACKILQGKVITGYYGTSYEVFDLEYNGIHSAKLS